MFDKFSMRSSYRAVRCAAVPLVDFVVATVMLVAAPLRADTYNWVVPSGDWSDAGNWLNSEGWADVPTTSDIAYIINGGTAAITLPGAVYNLYVGDPNSANRGTVQMSSGGLSATYSEYVGNTGTGTFTQSGGTNSVSDELDLAENVGSSGTYNLSGGSLFCGNLAIVGYSGTGSFAQSGGTNSSPTYLGWNSGSSGTYNLSGSGLLTAPVVGIGTIGGSGSFAQTGGTSSVWGNLYVGVNNCQGTYSLSGSGLLSTPTEYVGESGTGSFMQSGGTNSVSSSLYLGYVDALYGGSGTYNLSGSGLLSAPAEYMGQGGIPGTFNQLGGTNTVSSTLYLGSPSGSGTYNLSGSGMLSVATEFIGYAGTGTFMQSGGTHSVSSNLYIGYSYFGYGSGTYNLSGSGLLSAPWEYIGSGSDYPSNGTGSFTQSGGTNSVGSLVLGQSYGSAGTYNLNGGLLSLSGLTQGYGTAAFDFSGGIFQATSSFSTSVPIVLSTAGSNGVFDTNGNTLTLTGALSGPGGFQKIGSGTLILLASNGYTGRTLVSNGTLQIGNGGSGASIGSTSSVLDNGSLVFNHADTVNFAPVISGSGSLTNIGTGTLTLSASNGYTGTTLVAGGTLLLANTGAISGSTLDTSGSGSLSFSTLTSATFGGLQGSGNLSLNNTISAAVSLNVGGNNASTTFSGDLSGNGSLTKIGSGTLILSASNGYGGGTIVNAGIVKVDNNAALGVGVAALAVNGGTLDVHGYSVNVGPLNGMSTIDNLSGSGALTVGNGDTSSTFSGTLQNTLGQLSLIKTGSGTFGLGGNVALAGTATVSGGALNQSSGYVQPSTVVVDGGVYNLSGGSLSAPTEYLGYYGSGSFTQTGGAHSVSNTLYLGYSGSSSGSYSLSGSGLLSVYTEFTGYSGSGSFTQSSGTNSVSNELVLGGGSSSNGTYNLSGSGLLSAAIESIGTGSFTQSGGTNSGSYYLFLGTGYGASGTYTLSGNGLLSTGTEYIGYLGTASFTQSGGTHSVSSYLELGEFSGSSGTYNLSGSGLLSVSTEVIGIYATGSFTQSGGTNSVGGLSLAMVSGGSGTYTLSGSGLLSADQENIGYAGGAIGSFTQTGGTNAVSGNPLFLGNNSGSGTYNLSGSGLLSASVELIGIFGTGSFTQSGGTNSLSSYLQGGGGGTYNLSGSGLLSAPNEYIGNGGTSGFTQSGGTNSVSAVLFVGYGSSGSYNLGGSGLLSVPNEYIDYNDNGGTSSFTQSGGTNSVGSLVLGQFAGSAGTYNLNGGLLSLSGLASGGGIATFNFSGGTFQALSSFSTSVPIVFSTAGSNGVFDTNGNTLTLTGALSGPGGFQKIGSGTLILGGSNTYNGLTLINAGTLSLANSAALAGNGPINFGGGTLQFSASNTADYSSRIINSTSPIQIDTNGQNVTFTGSLASSNSGGLTKAGTGVLILRGSNNYSGPTIINGGTLELFSDNASSSFTANNGGTLFFNGASVNLNTRFVQALTGGNVQYQNVAITGGYLRGPGIHTFIAGSTNSLDATTINIGAMVQQNGPTTLTEVTNSGQFANNAPLTWNAGTNYIGSVLTVSNTATVCEFINEGVIVIASGGVLNNHETDLASGGGQFMVSSGGKLNVDSKNEGIALDLQDSLLVNNGAVTGTINVGYGATVQGSGTFGTVNVLDGGALAIAANAGPHVTSLAVSDGGITGAGQSALPATLTDATVTVPNLTDTLTLSGNLSGAGPLTKSGEGLLILGGNNSYDGGTNVVAGTLEVVSSSALADGTSLTVGAGATFIFDPTQAASAVMNSAAATAVPEPSTLVLLSVGTIGLLGHARRRRSSRKGPTVCRP